MGINKREIVLHTEYLMCQCRSLLSTVMTTDTLHQNAAGRKQQAKLHEAWEGDLRYRKINGRTAERMVMTSSQLGRKNGQCGWICTVLQCE